METISYPAATRSPVRTNGPRASTSMPAGRERASMPMSLSAIRPHREEGEGLTILWRFASITAFVVALLAAAPVVAGAQELSGVSGSRYVSPQFGYSLQWDDAWQVDRALSRPGFDALVLSDGPSEVVLSATTGYAGATGFIASPEQCV